MLWTKRQEETRQTEKQFSSWYVKKISYDRYFSSGKVQVCGATPAQVFCTLNVGVAFGEISLLAMGEGNKRTANIYSEWDDPNTKNYKFH